MAQQSSLDQVATAANTGEMRNIITLVPVSPTRLVCHEKYLKLGMYSTQAVHVDNISYREKERCKDRRSRGKEYEAERKIKERKPEDKDRKGHKQRIGRARMINRERCEWWTGRGGRNVDDVPYREGRGSRIGKGVHEGEWMKNRKGHG